MLIAEIRRKLLSVEDIDPSGPDALAQLRAILRETKEDLLTADVFGVLKYLPRRPYLAAVLETLAQRNPASPELQNALPQMRQGIQEWSFRFWPSYSTPYGLSDGRTEPDIQIADERSFLLFEAKLGSAFGERQIERELAVAENEADGREFFLVLVTPGSKPPRFRRGNHRLPASDYLETVSKQADLCREVRDVLFANRHRVLWLSWEAIQKALNNAHRQHCSAGLPDDDTIRRAADMLGDLNELMLLRQIQPFDGFSCLAGLPSEHMKWQARPVVMQGPSFQTHCFFQLSRALADISATHAWRCPGSDVASSVEAFVPLGRCCVSRKVTGETPILWFATKKPSSHLAYQLVRSLMRRPLPFGAAGFHLQRASGVSVSTDEYASELNVLDVQAVLRHRNMNTAASGFRITRSKR